MNNFAVLDITQNMIADGIRITITTNTPCHLTCYYTDKEPGSHRTARNQRGLTRPWGVYYCFVAWLSLEQTEPADTLIHTFDIIPWSYCQTKWFAFRGTVAGELSPSVSPIFKKHYAYKIYEELVGDIDGSYCLYEPTYRHAQTFTPQEAHRIVGLYLRLWRRNSPGIVTASITHTDAAEKPTPPDFTAGSIDGNTLPTAHPGEWVYIPLVPRNLAKGTLYAIVLKCQYELLCWTAGPYNGYLRGYHWGSHDEGATWRGYPWPLFFQDWGTPL